MDGRLPGQQDGKHEARVLGHASHSLAGSQSCPGAAVPFTTSRGDWASELRRPGDQDECRDESWTGARPSTGMWERQLGAQPNRAAAVQISRGEREGLHRTPRASQAWGTVAPPATPFSHYQTSLGALSCPAEEPQRAV